MLRLRFTSVASSVAIAVAAAFAAAVGAAGSVSANLNSLPADSGMRDGFRVRDGCVGQRVRRDDRRSRLQDNGRRRWLAVDDDGLGWSRVDALVVDPRRPATLYAGTGVAVFKTVNGGRSWRGANRGLLPPPPVMAAWTSDGNPRLAAW